MTSPVSPTAPRAAPLSGDARRDRRRALQAAGRTLMDDTVASPCVSVCKVEDDLCVGCARTVGEIVDWAYLTAEEKRGVLAALPGRAARIGAA